MDQIRVGTFLKALRKEKKLTQEQLEKGKARVWIGKPEKRQPRWRNTAGMR